MPERDHKQPITMLADRLLGAAAPGRGRAAVGEGILIPDTAQVGKRLTWAEVVAAGPHVRTVHPTDWVLLNPEDRFEVEVCNEEHLILQERDVHAVASERNDDVTGLYL